MFLINKIREIKAEAKMPKEINSGYGNLCRAVTYVLEEVSRQSKENIRRFCSSVKDSIGNYEDRRKEKMTTYENSQLSADALDKWLVKELKNNINFFD